MQQQTSSSNSQQQQLAEPQGLIINLVLCCDHCFRQHFLAHNEDGSKREPAWSNDLLTYDGKNAAVLFLECYVGQLVNRFHSRFTIINVSLNCDSIRELPSSRLIYREIYSLTDQQ